MEIVIAARPAVMTVIFGSLFGIASFAVTRGANGSLFGFFSSFGGIAILYLAYVYFAYVAVDRPHASPLILLTQLFLFEVFSAAAMLIDARLDEMAGMLYLMIPGALLLIIAMGGIVIVVGRQVRKSPRR